jgi:N-acetylglucosaminyldiphosphoundecaprenol N-acetyl-beta-D-mannosaminyltransferase
LEDGRQRVVVTPNTDHVVRIRRDASMRAIYERADIVVADGMPVVWASSLLGAPLPERVAGIDLMNAVVASLAARGASVFLLGGDSDVAPAAAQALAASNPGLRVSGTGNGYFDAASDDAVVAAVNESGADALFVGMGSPRQEEWALRRGPDLRPRIVLCIGGALEVVAGHRRRAPRWMQTAGLEWSYRLMQEPGRLWKRYLVEDAAFVGVVYDEWLQQRRSRAVRARSTSA